MAVAVFGLLFPAEAVQYTGASSRDPFSSPGGRVSQGLVQQALPTSLILNGIIWVPEKPRAIINGRRVTAGAEIDGAKVVEIRKKEVTILSNGQEVVLTVQEELT